MIYIKCHFRKTRVRHRPYELNPQKKTRFFGRDFCKVTPCVFSPVRGKPLKTSAGARPLYGLVRCLNEILTFSKKRIFFLCINQALSTHIFKVTPRKKKSLITYIRAQNDKSMAYASRPKFTFLHSISSRIHKSHFCAPVFGAPKKEGTFRIYERKIFMYARSKSS